MAVRRDITLPALFALLTGLPVLALGWLGWHVLTQERALERDGLRQRLQEATAVVSSEIDRQLKGWEGDLSSPISSVATPAGALLLSFGVDGVRTHAGVALPFYPLVAMERRTMPAGLLAAEAEEFRDADLASALTSYRLLSDNTSDRGLRAEILMRIARCLRKQGKTAEALEKYGELAAMSDSVVAGAPAPLIGHAERAALFRATGDSDAGAREQALLVNLLWGGTFQVDRATFDSYAGLDSPTPPTGRDAVNLAEAVESFWSDWQRRPAGRDAVLVRDGAFVTVWRTTTTGTTALVGPASALMAHANLAMLPVEIGLTDSTGRTLWGAPQRDDAVSRALQDVGLPLTLHVAMTDVAATLNASRQRWNLLGAGFGLMVLVIVAASCLVFRSVSRELAVAHLRSDFVATVSHEFRTPLAAMRHLTELLEDGGASAEKLGDYYRALGKETRRLQGMVEHLLDFGRMEAGRRGYQLREMDASALVRETVQEFREQAGSALRELQLTTPLEGPRIRADRAALVLAIRNLLDNAVKYSPASSPVTVSVARDSRGVSIAVEDQGPGISREEQRAVFRKFVRGTAAKALNVQGTGIGLTMAQRVARAHGGRIELMSTPGGGSRFTILLPAEIP